MVGGYPVVACRTVLLQALGLFVGFGMGLVRFEVSILVVCPKRGLLELGSRRPAYFPLTYLSLRV